MLSLTYMQSKIGRDGQATVSSTEVRTKYTTPFSVKYLPSTRLV